MLDDHDENHLRVELYTRLLKIGASAGPGRVTYKSVTVDIFTYKVNISYSEMGFYCLMIIYNLTAHQ